MSSKTAKPKAEMPLWRSIASLEPGLVMHMTAAIMVFMVVQDFMLEKACRVNLDYGDAVCDALKAKLEKNCIHTKIMKLFTFL